MDILTTLNNRYSAKIFDANKKITTGQLSQLEDLLQLSPSSTNLQPWHFILVHTEEGKNRMMKGTHGIYSFNQKKVEDAAVSIIFASKIDLTEEYLLEVLEKEDEDGRFPQKDFKEQNHSARSMFASMHKLDYKDFQHWADKQVYLNLGNFLLGSAAMGLDSIAMEGFDMKALDVEFGLREKGYTASVVVSLGYSAEDDYNKMLPKSRLSKEKIIERA
ncbi:MAG: oxygen-insensitive NAD(P)H nitroreductase [Eubacteriales bacterium]